jgi:DNA-binding transcriptional regulator YdaS (Cro superfamily)
LTCLKRGFTIRAMDTPTHPGFDAAVRHFGSQRALAAAIGVSDAYVSQCRHAGFSATTALAIERETAGALRALDLVRAPRHAVAA